MPLVDVFKKAAKSLDKRDRKEIMEELYDTKGENFLVSKIRDRLNRDKSLRAERNGKTESGRRIDLIVKKGKKCAIFEFKQYYDFDCVLHQREPTKSTKHLISGYKKDWEKLQKCEDADERCLVIIIAYSMVGEAPTENHFTYETTRRRAQKLVPKKENRDICVEKYFEDLKKKLPHSKSGEPITINLRPFRGVAFPLKFFFFVQANG